MSQKVSSILLIDDNPDDNFLHKYMIEKSGVCDTIYVATDGEKALDFLNDDNNPVPELIFLDINMPRMNGWEFLEEYKLLSEDKKQSVVVLMLTTSMNPHDKLRADEISDLTGYESKPLNEEKLARILKDYFNKNN